MGGGGSAHSTRDVGCGGLWRDVVEENGRKMGGQWEDNGTKYPFFTVPFPPFSRRPRMPLTVPVVKIGPPHSPTEKWECAPLADTHCHGGWCGCLSVPTAVGCDKVRGKLPALGTLGRPQSAKRRRAGTQMSRSCRMAQLSARAVLKENKKGVAKRNERSTGHCLLHGHGTLST